MTKFVRERTLLHAPIFGTFQNPPKTSQSDVSESDGMQKPGQIIAEAFVSASEG